MARKQNPDTKVIMIALAALGGLAAAYFVTKSKSGGSTARLADDAAAGNGGQLLLNNTPASSYVPPSYTPPPVAGGSVINKAAGERPATPKEKQQALNWLQALIQKNGSISIYNPFSEADLATGSFGPKSRAALAKANEIMRAAEAALPKTANRNLFQGGTAGDAALQALVDASTLEGPTYAPNAVETQALVKAAGGTAGSIGAATPSPSIIQQQVNPLWQNISTPSSTSGITATPCPAGRVGVIAYICNLVNDTLDYQMTLGSPAGIRVNNTSTLTEDTVASYRKVLGLFVWCAQNESHTLTSQAAASRRWPMPTKALVDRMTNPSTYTLFHKTAAGDVARFDPVVLDYFNAAWLSKRQFSGTSVGIDSTTTEADALELAYDDLSANRWRNNLVPDLLLTSEEARRLGVTNA